MTALRHRFAPIFASMAVCLVLTMAASAVEAQGYQGLFGDDEPTTTPTPTRKNDQPPGYQGLIPGAVPQAPAQAPAGSAATTQQPMPTTATTRPLQVAPGVSAAPSIVVGSGPSTAVPGAIIPIRTSDDLRKLAMIYSVDKNLDQVPDQMAAQFRLPETSIEMLKQPRPRINGMLPMENNVKNSIDGAMATLNDPRLRPADRQARARLAIESLKNMQLGLKAKANTPDRTYQVMGMPPVYIKEEREATTKSLQRIDAALKQLQGM